MIAAQQVRDRAAPARPGARDVDAASSSATGASSCTTSGRGCAPARSATTSTRGASRCSQTLKTVDPRTASEQSAYDQWLGQTTQREEARIDRVHGATGVIPITALVRPLLHRRGRLRLHALLRRPGRGGRDPGDADGRGGGGDDDAAAPARSTWTARTTAAPAASSRSRWTRTLDMVDQALKAIDVKVVLPCDANGARAHL